MSVFADTEQFYAAMRMLFDQIREQDSGSTGAVTASHLIIRLRCISPQGEININGRQAALHIEYGPSPVRPDLDVELTGNALHQILMAELPLKKALAGGQMRVRGPLMKIFALEEILHHGQALYPEVARRLGLDGYHPAAGRVTGGSYS